MVYKLNVLQDGAGRPIIRSEITFTHQDAKKIAQSLKTGEVHIYTRDYKQILDK